VKKNEGKGKGKESKEIYNLKYLMLHRTHYWKLMQK